MQVAVEAWGPDYGGELELGPLEAAAEAVDTACEGRPWEPVDPVPGRLAQSPVAFVDGTRRMDARVFVMNGRPAPIPGVAGTVGVGAVLCDPPGTSGRPVAPASCTAISVERLLVVGAGTSLGLAAGPGLEFMPLPHPSEDLEQLADAVHEHMRQREADLARELAADDDRLVFLDGPLAKMRPGPVRVVSYIKSHSRRYLAPEEEAVLPSLRCGQRTPLFAFGDPRPRYAWYLRLCDLEDGQHGWHGLVRCECPASLSLETAVELADAAAAILPRFASAPYWDARAPQNLVPVAGLEKRLRHLMGDRNLVTRKIRSAASRLGEGGGP